MERLCAKCNNPIEGKNKKWCKTCVTNMRTKCAHNIQKSKCVECDPESFKIIVFNKLLRYCERTDIKKGHVFDLDVEWIESMIVSQNGICYFCKRDLDINFGSHNSRQLSIDRSDNSIGHLKGNCVLSCLGCNLSKKDKPFTEFEATESRILMPSPDGPKIRREINESKDKVITTDILDEPEITWYRRLSNWVLGK